MFQYYFTFIKRFAFINAGLRTLYKTIAITELITAFTSVVQVVTATIALMALAAFSASGVRSVYHTHLSAGSNMQLKKSPAIVAIADHFNTLACDSACEILPTL